ncbi:SAMP-activating enzyme E1 [Candidatus Methanobinarius endosymbioticus]|uniref:SAMP-activating enzyme E1 n=1 Tax=Candidatus Methanobinarius endosymbioticus TaxID=2006182 RepID=A0A366MA91_9EURY|nr:SAMP-activating enzyme E1 [Candidatus Methanobinarius endosymbioticus]
MSYWEISSRQMSIVTKSEQTRFKDAKIAVIGCGGIGGVVIEMLGRMGVAELDIIDKDYFDMSNLNRQVMSSIDEIRNSKSGVTNEKIRLINSYVKVNAFNEELTPENIKKVVGDCEIVIDVLDNLFTRVLLSRYIEKKGIHLIRGAIHGPKGQLTVFNQETPSHEELFSLSSKGKNLDKNIHNELNQLSYETPPVIGPIANIIGCLESFEGFKIITNLEKITLAPKILNLNLLDVNSFKCLEL